MEQGYLKMARSLKQRIADLEKTVMDFFTGGSQKKAARKSRKTSSGRSAAKAKARKTSKRKSAR